MCGRFTLTKPPDLITQHFAVDRAASAIAKPRYNIAPMQTVYAVRLNAAAGSRELTEPRWGLIPSRTRDPKTATRLINARAETVATKPAFRDSYRARRCLIPADGFYEWQPSGKRKQPWYIYLRNEALFAFAGLWDQWHDSNGACIESCTIVTTAPNEVLAPIHDRMPVIIAPKDYEAWLSPSDRTPDELLRPYPAEAFRAHPVSALVGSPGNDVPGCREPVQVEANPVSPPPLFPN